MDILSRTHYDSHPSITASMSDFEARDFSPTIPVPDIPSQHSGFRSGTFSENSDTASSSRRSYSPPAWRKRGSGWFKHHENMIANRSGFVSKETTPQYEDTADHGELDGEDEVTAGYLPYPAKIPLPESPTKGRSPSPSPEHDSRAGQAAGRGSNVPHADTLHEETTQTLNNFFRFSAGVEVQHHTEPIEQAIRVLRSAYKRATRSRYTTFAYCFGVLLAWWIAASLLRAPQNGPAPDLIGLSSMVKSFEPSIYYSEHGHSQIEQLQETGIAVWDLGESVRSTNMTSAPIIVKQLDDLSESLRSLAHELTRFFANVDADIDNILWTMDWAQRELGALNAEPPSTITSVWSNTHSLLLRTGLIGNGELLAELFGQTHPQRTKATLQRTFHEFLGVLEESINNQISYSLSLFQLFEAIDKQFLNLQRTTIREQDQQERMETEFLASLWTKVIGVNASRLRKYERNRHLLHSVRDRTIRNKHVLLDHNQRLLSLKSNLEILRRKLVSPLVRAENSSTLSVEAQMRGLEGVYTELKGNREKQKAKMMELIYGTGNRRATLGGEGRYLEGSAS